MKERIPKEFPDLPREPELLCTPYTPIDMALYDADGEEMGFPILPDNIGP